MGRCATDGRQGTGVMRPETDDGEGVAVRPTGDGGNETGEGRRTLSLRGGSFYPTKQSLFGFSVILLVPSVLVLALTIKPKPQPHNPGSDSHTRPLARRSGGRCISQS